MAKATRGGATAPFPYYTGYQPFGSPGIAAGTILILKSQYDSRIEKDEWEPIRVTRDLTMYHWIHAPTPYEGKRYDPMYENQLPVDADVLDYWRYDFRMLTLQFMAELRGFGKTKHTALIDGDEDEDFTYGAFCTAVTELELSECDLLFEREFGNMYSVRHIDTVLRKC